MSIHQNCITKLIISKNQPKKKRHHGYYFPLIPTIFSILEKNYQKIGKMCCEQDVPEIECSYLVISITLKVMQLNIN